MTPAEFRQKWTGHHLKERSYAQEHFLDLCELVGHPKPAEADKDGEAFCFERGATKLGGAQGWADVWKRGHFGWEYKGLHKDLQAAYEQLLKYREDLENPPLLVVCDSDRIIIHTNFTNTVKVIHEIRLQDIDQPASLDTLRKVFHTPADLRPDATPQIVTEQAAERIGQIAENMRIRGVPPHDAAHFLMKLVFSLFCEDVGLLPRELMSRILDGARNDPPGFDGMIRSLFAAMRTGGRFGADVIAHFNGGLFDDEEAVLLQASELAALAQVAKLDWSAIEPSIFGTLFERSLDPAKRAQLGAHYTSREDILAIIEPVLMAPLRTEWDAVRARCEALLAGKGTDANKRAKVDREVKTFLDRLETIRVLDPACGSGNFLYVALAALKDLEKEVIRVAVGWHLTAPYPRADPSQLFGLEIDPYAAELAQLTVWIGYLQWMRMNGFTSLPTPILKPLHNIQQRDAIVGTSPPGPLSLRERGGTATAPAAVWEPEWPEADVIVGNPPFLGGKRLRTELGNEYVDRVFQLYEGRVPHEADLCCYWYERARAQIAAGRAKRAGLLATNSIRQGKNRVVLQRIADTGGVFMAWSDREWILNGAAVRTSMVGFDDGTQVERTLDGQAAVVVNPDLTSGPDMTRAKPLRANAGLSFMGDTKGGAFDIPGDLARAMLPAPNPLGRSNADVVKPWVNGSDVTQRPRDMWIIDFGVDTSEADAALYEMPFEYVREHVLPVRAGNRREAYAQRWWIHVEPRPAMSAALYGLSRYLATVIVAKHRLFVWLAPIVVPDHRLIVFARDDDYLLGVLHSRAHERWSLATGSWQGVGNDPVYTPQTCFETFPFPQPTEDQRAAISAAAKALHETRQSALDADPKLTLTGLYNKRPTWLDNLHRDLDTVVFAAYGWSPDLSDEELLERLLALNLERAEEEKQGIVRRP